jgi:hypothetical protein
VRHISLENLFKCAEIGLSHSLDDKPAIITEEKETATLSLRFTGLKDRFHVFLWV